MITSDKIKWGQYTNHGENVTYEGPYYPGTQRLTLDACKTIEQKLVWIVSQTEGGTTDAVNMYDVCITSVGIIQLCDRYNLVTKMLGHVASVVGVEAVTGPLSIALKHSGALFKQNKNGQWRFYVRDTECSTPEQLRNLYYAGCSGLKGEWTPEGRFRALQWAAGLASIFQDKRASAAQVDFCSSRLMSFVLPEVKRDLFATDGMSGFEGAVKAAYLSFAANNPTRAAVNYKLGSLNAHAEKFSKEWSYSILKQLTFGGNVKIYPGRYDRIRSPLETVFGVTLPKTSVDLQKWVNVVQPPAEVVEAFKETRDVDPTEAITLPESESAPTFISQPPDRANVTYEEASVPLPSPARVPAVTITAPRPSRSPLQGVFEFVLWLLSRFMKK